jgi:hypothetical protein|tara:strand:- start:48 stop:272 length:225 start_codon:yes stop_codon:yes gene_type:complete
MIDGKTFRVVLDKFLISPVAQGARVQIELPNGKFLDLHSVKLLENKLIGSKESHRLVLKTKEPTTTMGKIIGKL